MSKNKKSLLDLDATDIAKMIRRQEKSIEQIISTYIEQIKRTNPVINAVVEDRFMEAIEEARTKDEQFPKDFADFPLYGVPITVKESFNVSGMKTTGGLIHRKNKVADQDALIVKKLKDAGAIILGKTNTSTLCYCQESNNKLYGRTNNPWDINRTAGGSTGGEGAILAVGGSALGIGSDIGGSIRVPSHFNGIIGFQSGKQTISENGHFPASPEKLQQRMESYGPMGKSVRDMQAVYNIIAKNKSQEQSLKSTTINILPDTIPFPLNAQTKHLLNRLDEFLAKEFQTIREIPPYFKKSALLWQEMMSVNGSKHIEQIAFAGRSSGLPFTHIWEKITQNTNWHHHLLWAIMGSKLFKPSKKRVAKIKTILSEGDEKLKHYLNDQILILPVYHTSAKRHNDMFKEIFSIRKTFKKYMPYLAYANVWGLPTLTIPVGEDDRQLPIAIQIVGINGQENKLFKVSKRIEAKFRGYIRNKNFDY